MSAPDDEATPVRGITLRVGGMHCGSGAALLGEALPQVPGVSTDC